ncbi:hypothetical protein [Arthrobacter glacialis]|uniref:hypothetical protein n=1 Tax=Arthrobacter glacialis TaxID=1664 RepID=UPI000CD4187C|nr:hypothetical protein [Arthrobacter glacialis]POH58267.1 hypothetical protein CVS28_12555 [Arthrobacter glacialis]
MSDGLVFPDARSAVWDLLSGSVHFDPFTDSTVTVRPVTTLPVDAHGLLEEPFPLAHVRSAAPGTQGYVDRVDRVAIDVYAPLETALNVLESISTYLTGRSIDTPSGYLDAIEPDELPVDVPYPSEHVRQATATFLVTTRPL